MTDVTVTTIDGGAALVKESAIANLKSHLPGQLIRPTDVGYEGARKIWNGMIDRRPGVILRCDGTADVGAAVKFARQSGLLVSVRGGGHNIAGKAVSDGGLMIDLSRMRGVRVDVRKQVAHVQGGATLADLDRETQAFALATTAGVVTTTGVAGLTLGGGVGRLARKYGLACDNLLSAEVVTADGHTMRASATENTDLFWGVRGGGGNFGIVTAFEYQLHSVWPIIYGGLVLHPLERAKEAIEFFHAFSRSAPDEVRTACVLLTSPEGQPVLAIAASHIGPLEEGARVLAPLKNFGPPVMDQLGPVSYTEIQAAGDALFPTGRRYYWKSHFLTEIRSDAIDTILRHSQRLRQRSR
jgi:FAD binding domain